MTTTSTCNLCGDPIIRCDYDPAGSWHHDGSHTKADYFRHLNLGCYSKAQPMLESKGEVALMAKVRVIEDGASVLRDVEDLADGTEYNHTSFGYDVASRDGEGTTHVTTGDVRCDLGVCEHPGHRY